MNDPHEYDNLSDEEFCRLFANEYFDFVEKEKDEDYVINRPQWKKLVEVLDYFHKLADKSNGQVEPCELQPRLMHGGVTVSFVVMDLREEDIPGFCEAILKTNAITIDATADGRVCFSVSVPYVFIKKDS